MAEKTIVYLTDSQLDPWLADRCRELLLEAANGIPIVSVSQQPLDFGLNVCVGDIGRSGPSLETQIFEGLKRVETRWVAIAEHDCIYSKQYFEWTPPDDENFWYNDNAWLCQLHNPAHPHMDGMFSFMRGRRAQSQLICNTENFLKASGEKLGILTDPAWIGRYPKRYIGEPGNANPSKAMRLSKFRNMRGVRKKIKNYLTVYHAKDWRSDIPNIDIRHGHNFTGPRRGNKRSHTLEPWGTLYDVLGRPPVVSGSNDKRTENADNAPQGQRNEAMADIH